eukprot:c33244_g1_i1 orf=96-380(+)
MNKIYTWIKSKVMGGRVVYSARILHLFVFSIVLTKKEMGTSENLVVLCVWLISVLNGNTHKSTWSTTKKWSPTKNAGQACIDIDFCRCLILPNA